MKKKFLFLLIFAGISLLNAQGPAEGETPLPLRVITAYFGFDEAQTTQFEALLESRKTNLQPIYAEIEANRQAIGDMLNGENPDPETLGNLMLTGKALNDQTHLVLDAFASDFATMLTEEQMQKYQHLTLAKRLQPVLRAAEAIRLPLIPPEPAQE